MPKPLLATNTLSLSHSEPPLLPDKSNLGHGYSNSKPLWATATISQSHSGPPLPSIKATLGHYLAYLLSETKGTSHKLSHLYG